MFRSDVSQPLAFQAANHHTHLRKGVCMAEIMSTSELLNIPIKMFQTHLVINPLVRPFQHVPQALDPVGIDQFRSIGPVQTLVHCGFRC